MPMTKTTNKIHKLSAICLLVGGIALSTTSSLLATTSASAQTQVRPARANSFTGAFLAGSFAAESGSPYATPYFLRALQLSPGNQTVQQELLFSYIQNDNFDEAVRTAYSIREDKDPTVRPIIELLIAANAFRDRNYTTITDISATINDKDESLLWIFLNAWADYGRGKKDKAISSLKNTNFSEWHKFLGIYNIALIQDLSNDTDKARKAYQQALSFPQIMDASPETYEHLLLAYISFIARNDGYEKALKELQHRQDIGNFKTAALERLKNQIAAKRAVPRLVNSPAEGASEIAYDVGTTLLRAGEGVYANIYLQTALYLHPQDTATLFQLGLLAIKAQQPQKANAIFAKIPQKSAYHHDAELLRALSINQKLVKTKGNDEIYNKQAIKSLKKMIASSTNPADLQNILANSYLIIEDYPAGIKLLNQMLEEKSETNQSNWDLFFQRGIAYERSKNWPEAEKNFKIALKLSPKNADILNYYGFSMVDRHIRLDDALQMLRRANQISPNNAAILDSLGWAYYKLGRYDEAVPYLERAVVLEPAESELNDHLGDAYWRIGKHRDAVFQWNHALVFEPKAKEKPQIIAKLKNGLAPRQTDGKE